MSQSRRLVLRLGVLTIPALACTAIASAAERRDDGASPAGGLPGTILKGDGRATCPLCMAGQPCPDHLV